MIGSRTAILQSGYSLLFVKITLAIERFSVEGVVWYHKDVGHDVCYMIIYYVDIGRSRVEDDYEDKRDAERNAERK